MRTQLDVGIFAYCGLDDVESHLIYDVEGDRNDPVRRSGLAQAHQIGRSFIDPHRVVRHAKQEHLARRRAQGGPVTPCPR
jgi:NAD(P)H dehydrogenase (quinone)